MSQTAHIIPLRRDGSPPASPVAFNRSEVRALLSVYGRMVSIGEWRDYAIDFTAEVAQFAVFSRSAEYPVYRIEKRPKQARRQGVYALIGSDGRILRRDMKIERVLGWFENGKEKRAAILPFGKHGRRGIARNGVHFVLLRPDPRLPRACFAAISS